MSQKPSKHRNLLQNVMDIKSCEENYPESRVDESMGLVSSEFAVLTAGRENSSQGCIISVHTIPHLSYSLCSP